MRRAMGIETEYGILGGPGVRSNPMMLSALVVAAYAQAVPERGRVRWSYESEDPLADARGFRLDRASAHPSMLTDAPGRPEAATAARRPRPRGPERDDPAAANVILSNGARLYVDHAHPEYSSPEVATARGAVLWDRAGEEVMLTAARTLAASPHSPDVLLYKNNVDGKGASYGTHENYLVERSVPFGEIVRYLTAFLVTRQIFVGAGRVGIGQTGGEVGFQISQRADYIEAEVGLETTLRRPIINTRDEPHADAGRFRRLHVIIGDANCHEIATYLKLGTTSLVLAVLETGQVPLAWESLVLADPVAEVQSVSRDLDLTHRLALADGGTATALEIQRTYLQGVQELLAVGGTSPDLGGTQEVPDADSTDVVARWEGVLSALASDRAAAAREVEWLAKLQVLEGLRHRHGLGWDHPKLAAVDLQWSDVRPERGIFARLRDAGAVATLVTPQEVACAVREPPPDTRAYFRGEVVRRYAEHVSSAGWDGITFDIPGEPTLIRVPMPDPLRGTRAQVEGLLDASPDAASLLRGLFPVRPSSE